MTNDVAKRDDTYAARYAGDDPYANFANESGPGIVGKLLTCRKGDWTVGSDATPVPVGSRFLFVVPETMRGWMKWEGGTITAADMGFVRDGHPLKHRNALGDLDEERWEKNPDGTPRDPWSRSYRALLVEVSPPHGDVTLGGSSYGLSLALKDICGIYSAEARLHPDAYPVVTLTTKTRQHKSFGPIKGPWFDVVGWATPDDVKAGRKTAGPARVAKAKAPKAKPVPDVAAELNDEMPDWGNAAA